MTDEGPRDGEVQARPPEAGRPAEPLSEASLAEFMRQFQNQPVVRIPYLAPLTAAAMMDGGAPPDTMLSPEALEVRHDPSGRELHVSVRVSEREMREHDNDLLEVLRSRFQGSQSAREREESRWGQQAAMDRLLALLSPPTAPHDRVATLFGIPIYERPGYVLNMQRELLESRIRRAIGMPFIPVNPELWAEYTNMSPEDLTQMMAQLGIQNELARASSLVPTRDIGKAIRGEITTLREKVFCRLFAAMSPRANGFYELRLGIVGENSFVIKPKGKALTLKRIMAAARAVPACRKALARIRFTQAASGANHPNPELVSALQDLGDIVAYEATAALKADYYPGVAGMEWIPDEHVDAVMAALQRELDREGMTRSRIAPDLAAMPRERQRALAERRRMWFGKFGITPKNWKRGTFSLWDVANDPPPGQVKYDAIPS